MIFGDKITAQLKPSEKGEWKVVGQSDIAAQGAARVGVMAGGAPKEADRHVRFRDFRIVELAGEK